MKNELQMEINVEVLMIVERLKISLKDYVPCPE